MTRASGAELRALKQALAGAPDCKIMQIATLAESLADREEAQDLLEPIRARLRPLRPERKLRLARLLATPLQAVLCDASAWHDGAPALPRNAIKPLTDVISIADPLLTADIEAMIAGATTRNTDLIARAGALLWPAAARILAAAGNAPPGWQCAGLPEKRFRGLAQAAAGCLEMAPRLDAYRDPTANVPQVDERLSAALREAGAAGPVPWGMLLVFLVCHLPHVPGPRDLLLSQNAGQIRRDMAAASLAHVWHWIEDAAEATPPDLMDAAAALQDRASLLQAFTGEKAWRPRAGGLQLALRDSYAAHLQAMAQERLVTPLSALTAAPDDPAMAALETEARGLRRLALAIRAMGPLPQADAVLRRAAQAAAANRVLAAVDRARLVEILDESDTAMRVLAK